MAPRISVKPRGTSMRTRALALILASAAACSQDAPRRVVSRSDHDSVAANSRHGTGDTLRFSLIAQNDDLLPHFFPPQVESLGDTTGCAEMLVGGRFVIAGRRWEYADSSRITCPSRL